MNSTYSLKYNIILWLKIFIFLFLSQVTAAREIRKSVIVNSNNTISEDYLKIAFIGSSTTLGKGASLPDKAYVNLVKTYYIGIYSNYVSVNLAASGYDTYRLLPTGGPAVANRPAPDITRNITAALATHPGIIICNIPSNDVALNYTNEEYINNLKTIRAAADTAGVPIFFTTTQPRNFTALSQRQQLQDQAALIRSEFNPWVIDIYDELADFPALNIKTTYNSGDGIHLNDAGHAYLAAAVEKAVDAHLLALQYKNNTAPVVHTGPDQTITLPLNTVTLTGTASDNGSISAYNWTQQSGPTALLNGTADSTLIITNLLAGTYLFRLTVTDNLGAASFDEVTILVHPAPPVLQVISFTLINADTEQPILDLKPNDVLDLATLPSQRLNIRVNTNSVPVGSVTMALSGIAIKNTSDATAPYALYGDVDGNYAAWTPAAGSYTLIATPYNTASAGGLAGIPLSLNFNIINTTKFSLTLTTKGSGTVTKSPNQTSYVTGTSVKITATPAPGYKFSGWSGAATGATNPLTITMTSNKSITANFVFIQKVISFTLINAVTDQPIRDMLPNETLNLAKLPTKYINIRANTNPAKVGSVKLVLSGKQSKTVTETASPYALFGDNLGNYSSWTPAVGTYTLKATPYTLSSGGGSAGTPLTLNFSVINQPTTASRIMATDQEKENTSEFLVAYPSPTLDGQLQVAFGSELEGKLSYTLLSATGTKLAHSDLLLAEPTSRITFDFSQHTKVRGLYYLHLEKSGWHKIVKIIRQ